MTNTDLKNKNNFKSAKLYLDCISSKIVVKCFLCNAISKVIVSIFDNNNEPIIVCETCVLFVIANGLAEVLDF